MTNHEAKKDAQKILKGLTYTKLSAKLVSFEDLMKTKIEKLPPINIEKMYPSGGYRVSCILDNQYIHRIYLGYTKKSALAEFKRHISG